MTEGLQLQVTAIYTFFLATLFVTMGVRVAMFRIRNKIGIGFKGNSKLMQLAGAHSNAAENIPFALLLLAMMELQSGSLILLHICGAILLTARLMHAYGCSRYPGTSFGRRYGIMATWYLMLFMATANLYLATSGSDGVF